MCGVETISMDKAIMAMAVAAFLVGIGYVSSKIIWEANRHRDQGPPKDGLAMCADFCNSSGEGYVDVKQMSMGTCICNNDEGQRVALGYHLFLNNKCFIPQDKWRFQ
jgi:hypothetical protein